LRLPTVSVVIATWNRPRLVRRLVSQLREQTTCPNAFEIVVVDDGSEPPLALPGPSPGPGPKVMLVRQENAGPASARHRGILEAEGALILLLDDDMSVAPDFLAAHLRQHAAEGRRVVLGQIRPDPDLARMPLFERFHAAMLDRFVADVDSGRITVSGTHVCTGNVSFPRADYLAVGGFDSSFDRSEDAELGIRLQKAGLTLVLSKEAASTHRSDHTRLGVWMKRAYRYGINDRRIGWKHESEPGANPWRFLHLMNPVARPLLLTSAFLPRVGLVLATTGMWLAIVLDKVDLKRVALAGTTVVYGMRYFQGVREALGSSRNALADLRAYLAARSGSGAVAK
jgi:GT2 family glycosyltransferase